MKLHAIVSIRELEKMAIATNHNHSLFVNASQKQQISYTLTNKMVVLFRLEGVCPKDLHNQYTVKTNYHESYANMITPKSAIPIHCSLSLSRKIHVVTRS